LDDSEYFQTEDRALLFGLSDLVGKYLFSVFFCRKSHDVPWYSKMNDIQLLGLAASVQAKHSLRHTHSGSLTNCFHSSAISVNAIHAAATVSCK
jgi:hypothetical protein